MSAESERHENHNTIPQAPPLPPKSFQGVRNAAYRFIGLPSRPPSPKLSKVDLTIASAFDRGPTIGIGQSATTSHRTGLEINTLSINDRGTCALIGGKELFKIVKIENGLCIEERNLRTEIRSTPTQASGHVRQVYSIDIADVAWAKGDCGDYVAAATTSGKIILYDLGHAALQAALLHEHYRQVHKVSFNPHRGSLLLSGSQDGTVRLWDVRDVRTHASTLQSKRKFSGQSDGVRDVKWSPTEGVDFAFGTDSGWVQRWDMRNLKVPKIRIPAHHSSCTSLDWHPDGKHLLSTGMDKMMRIWEFSGSRMHKPAYELKTPYPISNARWRPACESSLVRDNGSRICMQIVAAYDRDHPVVHIWDLRRPALPFRSFTPYASAPTDLLWHSQDLVWTVGREGVFQQTDVHHTTKHIETRNLQALALASNGHTAFSLQRRKQRPALRHHSLPKLQTPTTSLSQSPESIQLSRSWADDTLDHSFLSTHGTRRPSQVKILSKSSRITSTPPSGLVKNPVLSLDDVLLHRQTFTPPQPSFMGATPVHLPVAIVKGLEHAYMSSFSSSSGEKTLLELLTSIFEGYAEAAVAAKQPRLAQTWRIVAFVTSRHLIERLNNSEGARNSLVQRQGSGKGYDFEHMIEDVLDLLSSPGPSSFNSPASIRPMNTIAQTLAMTESTSNVPTPLAKAVSTQPAPQSQLARDLPDVETGADLDPLPPSLTGHKAPDHASHLRTSATTDQSKHARPLPISKKHDQPELGSKAQRPGLFKHDSEESFVFMVGSQSSGAQSPGSVDSSAGPSSMVRERMPRPVLRINSASPLPSELHDALSKSNESHVNLSPTQPFIFPHDEPDDTSQAGSAMHASKELVRPVAVEHADISALRASMTKVPEDGEPFSLLEMLQELLSYYTTTQIDLQTASYLLTTVMPLLPETHQPEVATIKTCLSIYGETMLGEGFAIEDIAALLSQSLRHMLHAGVHPLHYESVLSSHHEQSQALGLHVAAASLRKLAYPIFPSVYDHGLDQDDFVLKCGGCKERWAYENDTMRCPSCSTSQRQTLCSICFSNSSPFGSRTGGNLLTICLLCTHSVHVDCSAQWFGPMKSRSCPTEGCLCRCSAAG